MAEIIPFSQLENKIDFLRKRNPELKIVATNGCFDILHVGHVRYLQKAKTYGTLLVVGLNSNESVKKFKGNNRPINKENDRAEVLAALECIDIVSIFNEETAEEFLKKVRPHIYVKGNDYNLDELAEAKLVKENDGIVIGIPIVPGFSTTNLIEKMK